MQDDKNTNPTQPLWDMEDVTAYLKKSREWVYKHSTGGYHPQLPYLKLGAALRFRKAEIDVWLDELRRKARPI